MRKVHEKSIILGIGIGMIITAIAGMIFSAGASKELSKAEIISLAKGYGLIEPVKFLNKNAPSDSTNSAVDSTASASDTAGSTTADSTIAGTTASSTTAVDTSSNGTKRDIIIEIKDGYKSQNVIDALLEKGVIKSEKDFNSVLDFYKASTKIGIGTFKFKKNEDLHYIVKTICNIK